MLNFRQNCLLRDSTAPTWGAGYRVTVYPVGGVVTDTGADVTIILHPGHSFRKGDHGLIIQGNTSTYTAAVLTATGTSITFSSAIYGVNVGDRIVNLGHDTGSGAANFDGSPMKISDHPDGSSEITNATLVASSAGEYEYHFKGDGRCWELVRDSFGNVVDVVAGFGAVAGRLNIADYGAAIDGLTDDYQRIQGAVDAADSGSVSQVYFPQGTALSSEAPILCASDVDLVGTGWRSILSAPVTTTDPLVSVASVSDVTIRDLAMHSTSSTAQAGLIEISGSASRIAVKNCELYNGYSGVWIKQGSRISILDSHIYDHWHPVYIGHNVAGSGGDITGILVRGCDIHSSIAGADAIKCIKQCHDITIADSILHENTRDAIDMFVSGDRTTITGNLMYGNTVHAIDMKSDETNYAPASWGSAQKIVIANNIMRGNDSGIRITQETATAGDMNRYISIANNVITDNAIYGILLEAPHATVIGNVIAGNCTNTGGNYHALYVLGLNLDVQNVSLIGNTITNNGSASTTTAAINLGNCNHVVVVGNSIDNDSTFANDETDIGINIQADCSNILLLGNTVGSGVATALSDSGTGTQLLANIGITNSPGLSELYITSGDLVVTGELGNIALDGGASAGHRIDFTRAGANYIRATTAGGTLVVRTNASATDMLTVGASSVSTGADLAVAGVLSSTGNLTSGGHIRGASAAVNVTGNDAIATADRFLINLTNVSGTNTITLNAPSSVDGKILILRCAALTADTITLADSGNVALSAAWVPDAGDTLTLVAAGVVWYEIARAAN